MRQMIAVPARQSRVAAVFKQEAQRRRFDVAVAKDHVGFALRRSNSVKPPRIVRPLRVAEINRAVGDAAIEQRCPHSSEIGAGFHHHRNVGGADEIEAEPVGADTKVFIGGLHLRIPQGRGPTAKIRTPPGSSR